MSHALAAIRHSVYVYLVAFAGALGVSQVLNLADLSTVHGAELALGPAALGALVSVLRTGSPALLSAVATALQSAAPVAPPASPSDVS
ncbi:MAG TPA: hypothetical protein VN375_19250 [Vicinamibacteria bacterium]|nr:hypothetical protein [Vicinamibacteria bacterium]